MVDSGDGFDVSVALQEQVPMVRPKAVVAPQTSVHRGLGNFTHFCVMVDLGSCGRSSSFGLVDYFYVPLVSGRLLDVFSFFYVKVNYDPGADSVRCRRPLDEFCTCST